MSGEKTICDFCHEREAVIFLEQISVTGKKKKINICMECAMARGIGSDPKEIESSFGDLYSELASVAKRIEAENNRMCPVCGTSLMYIKKNGTAGCPECYSIFKNQIRTQLQDKGITGEYSGSMPQRLASFKSVLNDRIALQNKLNDAIASENYEKAAMYRDYLKALEKTPVASSDDGGLFDDPSSKENDKLDDGREQK